MPASASAMPGHAVPNFAIALELGIRWELVNPTLATCAMKNLAIGNGQ